MPKACRQAAPVPVRCSRNRRRIREGLFSRSCAFGETTKETERHGKARGQDRARDGAAGKRDGLAAAKQFVDEGAYVVIHRRR